MREIESSSDEPVRDMRERSQPQSKISIRVDQELQYGH